MRIIFLIGFLSFVSCSTIKISGIYTYKSNVGQEYFTFNDDGTFFYNCEISMVQSQSSGVWKKNKNKITLLSDNSYKNDLIIVEEDKNDKNKIIRIEGDSINFKYFEISINNVKFYPDEKGEILLNRPLEKDDRIAVSSVYLSQRSKVVKLLSDEVSSLKLIIYKLNTLKVYFENDTLKIKGNRLFINKKKNYLKNNYNIPN